MEGFERVELFAGAEELDRRAGDRAHGERRAAARIAIGARQDDAGELHAVVEGLGDVHRVLTGQRIRDEQGLVRLGLRFRTCATSVINCFVDVLAAGGVEDQHVVAADLRRRHRALGDVDRRLVRHDGKRRHARLLAENLAAAPSRRDGARRATPSARASSRASAASARAWPRSWSCPSPASRPSGSARAASRDRAPEFSAPSVSTSTSWTILTTCWPGVTERMTFSPMARGRTLSMKSLTTGSATSASISAVRTSASASSTSALAERAAPAKPVERGAEALLQDCRTSNLKPKARTPQGAHLRCLGAILSRAQDRKDLGLSGSGRVLGPARQVKCRLSRLAEASLRAVTFNPSFWPR